MANIFENASKYATSTTTSNYSSGAVVGYTNIYNTLIAF